MKKLFSLIVITLLSTASYSAEAKPNSKSQRAEQFDLQAYGLYDRGQYLSAIESWERALTLYKKAKQPDKVGDVTLEISHAQKASGQGVAACSTLQRYLKAEPSLCVPANGVQDIAPPTIGPTENDAIAAMDFARIVRNFGLFKQAKLYANAAVQSAKANNLNNIIPDLAISSANIDLVKLMFERDRWSYQEKTHLTNVQANQLISRFSQIFGEYKQQMDTPVGYEAKLKWLTTYQELQKQSQLFKNSNLQNYPDTLRSQYISLLQNISGFDNFDQFPPSEQLRVRYDIAQILNTANQSISNQSLHESSQVWIENLITAAKQRNHQTYLAYGYALLGDRYQSQGKLEQAIRAFHLASKISQINHPRYRWQHTIAKLHESLGNETQAEHHYNSAIALVEEAEFNMSPLDQSVQTHFQESIRPIFDDSIRFQLKKDQPNFTRIFTLRNQYSDKIVETYLGCEDLDTLDTQSIAEKDSSAAIVSIFKIDQHYFTILNNGDRYAYSKTPAYPIDKIVGGLTDLFTGENLKIRVPTLNTYLERLYRQLLEPVSSNITPGQTILFANLEPKLQQIPMALLFDGESYLAQKNPNALIGSTRFSPKPLDPESDILFAGLSKPNQSNPTFEDLPYVDEEVLTINPDTVILNNDFTKSKLSNEVRKNLPILHIATHGQFSSQPETTFLLAWNEKIGLSELSEVVESRTRSGTPIELLILSACETAVGDRLATLGLAGISIQAGSRSTLATLWQATDESSPEFMRRFYFYLRSGQSKAKAMQLAQVEMIQEGYFPYSWAPYILMGSWL